MGCILLSTAVGSYAATLGRHSGAAVIGRPLDVRVQALLGPAEDVSSICAQADVFYGDSQVSPGAVRISTQKSAPDAEASVRVQSSVPVDEPIVTIYVRAGCTTPFSRRYVLLADPLTEPQTAAAPVPPPAAASTAAVPVSPALPARALPSASAIAAAAGADPRAEASPSGSGGARSAETAASQPPATTRPAVRPSAVKPARPASVVKRPVEPAAPRLELDPVDMNLSLDRDPVLKLSLSMLSEPTASDEERAAAASLWKAINASPEDILRDTQKLSVLEAEAKGLREQEAINKAAMQEMQARLDQTRYLSWLVYGLGALLLLAAFVGWRLWRRRGTDGDSAKRAWWAAAAAEKEQEAGTLAMPNGKAGAEALDLDLNLDLDRASSLDGMRSLHGDSDLGADSTPAVLLSPDKREFGASQAPVSRSVATEELFDVQQQADFFVSLGEDEQAIQVLKNHLAESQEPSALAYLDLFKLYHKLNRRADYEKLRGEFNRQFNAGAPPFEQYSDQSQGLEAYETAFGRIQALWPQPRVLDVIEKSIFREPGDVETEMFDLEAYRELLLLHAIAKDMIKRDEVGAKTGEDFQHTAIKPLKAAGNKVLAAAVAAEAVAGRETRPLDTTPHASPRLGLDVDLDELSEISAFEASLPEVPVPVEASAKPAGRPGTGPDIDMGNLIDFEMLDFMPPDDDDTEASKTGKKK
jgi:hypothetical protein